MPGSRSPKRKPGQRAARRVQQEPPEQGEMRAAQTPRRKPGQRWPRTEPGVAGAGWLAGGSVSEAEAGAVAEGTVAGGAESGAIVLVGESPAKSSGSGLPAVRDREADAALERVPGPALEQAPALDRDAAPVLDRDRDLVGGVRPALEEASPVTEETQPEAKEASSKTGGAPPGGGTAAASGRGPDTETPAEGYSAEVGTVCTAIRIN